MASHSSANATKLKTFADILQFVKEVLQIQISSKKPLFVIAKILLSILYFSLTSDLTNSANAKFIKKKEKKTIPKSFFIFYSKPNLSVKKTLFHMSFEDIKVAYQRKRKEFHPDTLLSKGLPEELLEKAKEKFIEIQSAFEEIEKRKNK